MTTLVYRKMRGFERSYLTGPNWEISRYGVVKKKKVLARHGVCFSLRRNGSSVDVDRLEIVSVDAVKVVGRFFRLCI